MGASTSAVVVAVVLTADAVVCIVTVAVQALPRHQHQDHDVPLSRSFPSATTAAQGGALEKRRRSGILDKVKLSVAAT
jgi:hypothetical protein